MEIISDIWKYGETVKIIYSFQNCKTDASMHNLHVLVLKLMLAKNKRGLTKLMSSSTSMTPTFDQSEAQKMWHDIQTDMMTF